MVATTAFICYVEFCIGWGVSTIQRHLCTFSVCLHVQQTIQIKRGFLNNLLTFSLDFECTDLTTVQRPPN